MAALHALVRQPGPELRDCELTHMERAPLDPERALEQHGALVQALEGLGVRVRVLEPLTGQPDACFVEDALRVHDEVSILTRPGAAVRRPEVAAIAPFAPSDRPTVHLTEASIELDGGDLVLLEDTILCGQSTRTNHAGLKALAHAVLPFGLRVKAVPVRGALHLQTALTVLPDGALLVQPEWVDLAHVPDVPRILVDGREPFGANALVVGEALLAPAAHVRTLEGLRARGYDVHPVEIGEFQKAEAGVTCLVEVWRAR